MADHPKVTQENRLPGDPDREAFLDSLLRVDQAGEYGAKRIYEGQLAVLKGTKSEPVIREMLAQELEHLDTFNTLVAERGARPTALQPLWHVAGFLLGAGTAALGERAAMACTVAVEEVIDEHYAEQAEQLGDDEAELRATIEKFREEEQHHRETGLAHEAELTAGYEVLTEAIRMGTRAAIWLAKRV